MYYWRVNCDDGLGNSKSFFISTGEFLENKEDVKRYINEINPYFALTSCVAWNEITKKDYDINCVNNPYVRFTNSDKAHHHCYWYVTYRFCDHSDGGAFNYKTYKSEFSIAFATMEIERHVGATVYITDWRKISIKQFNDINTYLIGRRAS